MTDRKKEPHTEANTGLDEMDELQVDEQYMQDVNDITDDEEITVETIKRLKKQLQQIKEEKRQANELVQRTKADFLNAKKRLEEEMASKILRERESVLEDLLPVCDSFQMAMQNTEQWEKVDKVWRTGVEGIYAQLHSVLETYQVKQVQPLGEQFDPGIHEAIDEVPVSDELAHNTITRVIQSGYITTDSSGNTRVLRPARVVVASDSVN